MYGLFEDQRDLSDLFTGSVSLLSALSLLVQMSLLFSVVNRVIGLVLIISEFGLPVQVRDAALGRKNTAPTSDINKREFTFSRIVMKLICRISYSKSRETGKPIVYLFMGKLAMTNECRWKIHQME